MSGCKPRGRRSIPGDGPRLGHKSTAENSSERKIKRAATRSSPVGERMPFFILVSDERISATMSGEAGRPQRERAYAGISPPTWATSSSARPATRAHGVSAACQSARVVIFLRIR